LVVPLSGETDSSLLLVGLADGAGGVSLTDTQIAGHTYDIVSTDANRDGILDLVVGNGSYHRLELYFGNGLGEFSTPAFVELPLGTSVSFVIASLDLNRDGNPDFAAGGPGGDNLTIAVDQRSGTTESLDEMFVIGYDGIAVEVTNPLGFVVSEDFQTIAGSDYWRHDLDGSGQLDDESFDYNLMYGEYAIRLFPAPGAVPVTRAAGIGIDGSRFCTIFKDYRFSPPPGAEAMYPASADTVTFYWESELEPSIFPDNGIPTGNQQPNFNWEKKVDNLPPGWTYHFQLSPYYDFSTTRFDVAGLDSGVYRPDSLLGIDSVYYWHFMTSDGIVEADTSRTFAAYIVSSCCIGMSGNIDGDPDGLVDIGDLTALITYLYVPPNSAPPCMPEANIDGDIGGLVDIGDLTALISYLYVPPNSAPAECR
jgi:hypothetical protein